MIKNLQAVERQSYALDALKILCCVMVIWSHSAVLKNSEESVFVPIGAGWISVHIFYMISGLLMVNSYFSSKSGGSPEEQTGIFMLRKIKSIGLQYFSALFVAFCAYLCARIHSSGVKQLWKVVAQTMPEWFVFYNASGVRPREINAPTWYISGMLTGMLLLYYLLARNPKCYLYIFSPLAALSLFGFMYQSEGLFLDRSYHVGIFQGSWIRAICGLTFGALAWLMACKLREIELMKAHKIWLTGLEILLYIFFFAMWLAPDQDATTAYSALVLLPFMLALTFSGKSHTAVFFSSSIWQRANSFAIALFFNHWSARTIVRTMFSEHNYLKSLVIMLGLTLVFCAIYYGVMQILKSLLKLS